MEMDLFANLTALSPSEDRRGAAHVVLSGAKERAVVNAARVIERASSGRVKADEEEEQEDKDGDRSTAVSELDESVSSIQCSADLSAFIGFQTRIHSHDGNADRRDENAKQQMRLALDLGSSTKQHDFRPQGVSVSQLSQNTSYSQQDYAELFYRDTQDEPEQQEQQIESPTKTKAEPTFVARGGEDKGVQRSPSRAFLFSLENEMNKRKQKNSTSDASEGSGGALQNGSPVTTSAKTTANASGVYKTENETSGIWSGKLAGGEEFGRDPQFIRGMPTPPLTTEYYADDNAVDVDEHPTFASFRETSITDSPLTSPIRYQFEPRAERDDVESAPLFSSYEDGSNKENEGDAYDYGRRDSIDSFPDTQSLGDAEMDDADDADMETAKTTTRSYSMEAKALDNQDDDDEDELPTQPSTSAETPARRTTISPIQDTLASPARVALKKRDKGTPHALPALTGSVQKTYEFSDSSSSSTHLAAKTSSSASRNLAFSFATPDSQESQWHALGSVPDAAMLASKVLNAISDADKVVATKGTTAAVPPNAPRKNDVPNTPVTATPAKKKASSDSASTTGTSSVESTPVRRKRKRAFVSPDVGVRDSPTPVGGGQEATPVHSKRVAARSGWSSTATPSSNHSTPSVRRTRAKLLSPLPSTRPYASRTKTIFKYKFEFCLTGFVKDGEESLINLIEGHGGRIAERYEDLLKKSNPKAVVIATPVSWRKRKFIYAVACGIPVVHPEWVQACAKAGQVVPFDGFFIPSGYSIATRKFECLPVQQLDIFAGMTFGIPYDVEHTSATSVKDMSSLVAFVLKACGASHVIEDLQKKQIVDVVLSDELTKRLLNPESDLFRPQSHDEDDESEQVLAAISTEIGDEDRSTLKLHTGELVLADLTGNQIDHHRLCDVCEILRITIIPEDDDDDDRRRADGKHGAVLEVGVLKRVHSTILEIPASRVKGRVVAVSKTDFQAMEFGDDSIFYYEEEN